MLLFQCFVQHLAVFCNKKLQFSYLERVQDRSKLSHSRKSFIQHDFRTIFPQIVLCLKLERSTPQLDRSPQYDYPHSSSRFYSTGPIGFLRFLTGLLMKFMLIKYSLGLEYSITKFCLSSSFYVCRSVVNTYYQEPIIQYTEKNPSLNTRKQGVSVLRVD